jgi:hypothetical protein
MISLDSSTVFLITTLFETVPAIVKHWSSAFWRKAIDARVFVYVEGSMSYFITTEKSV